MRAIADLNIGKRQLLPGQRMSGTGRWGSPIASVRIEDRSRALERISCRGLGRGARVLLEFLNSSEGGYELLGEMRSDGQTADGVLLGCEHGLQQVSPVVTREKERTARLEDVSEPAHGTSHRHSRCLWPDCGSLPTRRRGAWGV